jgi:hypothetical protein
MKYYLSKTHNCRNGDLVFKFEETVYDGIFRYKRSKIIMVKPQDFEKAEKKPYIFTIENMSQHMSENGDVENTTDYNAHFIKAERVFGEKLLNVYYVIPAFRSETEAFAETEKTLKNA